MSTPCVYPLCLPHPVSTLFPFVRRSRNYNNRAQAKAVDLYINVMIPRQLPACTALCSTLYLGAKYRYISIVLSGSAPQIPKFPINISIDPDPLSNIFLQLTQVLQSHEVWVTIYYKTNISASFSITHCFDRRFELSIMLLR